MCALSLHFLLQETHMLTCLVLYSTLFVHVHASNSQYHKLLLCAQHEKMSGSFYKNYALHVVLSLNVFFLKHIKYVRRNLLTTSIVSKHWQL